VENNHLAAGRPSVSPIPKRAASPLNIRRSWNDFRFLPVFFLQWGDEYFTKTNPTKTTGKGTSSTRADNRRQIDVRAD